MTKCQADCVFYELAKTSIPVKDHNRAMRWIGAYAKKMDKSDSWWYEQNRTCYLDRLESIRGAAQFLATNPQFINEAIRLD